MKSTEYRTIITTIIKNISKKRLPGVKEKHLKEIASEAAKVIHARMYGANVDNVDSPIWRDYDAPGTGRSNSTGGYNQFADARSSGINYPTTDASDLLK